MEWLESIIYTYLMLAYCKMAWQTHLERATVKRLAKRGQLNYLLLWVIVLILSPLTWPLMEYVWWKKQ